MGIDVTYYAMLASFITHELDAVKRNEWRVLPVVRLLPEKIGEQVFIWSHVPLIITVLWFGEQQSTMESFRFGLAAFAVGHVGLHWLFRKHPAYEFNNFSSWSLVIVTGLLGIVYLLAATV